MPHFSVSSRYCTSTWSAKVTELSGHKSLYSDAYYDEAAFRARYGGETYTALKERYDPQGRLLDLYAKAVGRR